MKKSLLLFFIFGFVLCIEAQNYRLVWPKHEYVTDNNNIVFQWSPVDDAVSYDLEISEDEYFQLPSSNYVQGITGTSQALTLNYRKTYYWRIRATTSQGDQAWSYSYKFTTFEVGQLSGLLLWFDAGQNITTAGSSVSQWVDRSANITASQSGSNKPAFVNSVFQLNNKPVVRFNGTTNPNYLSFPTVTLNGAGGFSMLAVRNYQPNGVNPAYLQYFLGGNNSGFCSQAPYYNHNPPGANGWGAYTTTTGYNGLFTTTGADITTTYSIYSTLADKLVRNGDQRVQGFDQEPSRMDARSVFSLSRIGTRENAPTIFSFKGDIAEMILYDNTLDDPTRVLAEQYLRYKYANPANLGKDTIFSSFCVSDSLSPGNCYFNSYLWSTGATTPKIHATNFGQYWVRTTDIFGFTTYDTINIRPTIPFNQLPPTAAFCLGDSLVWNTGYPASGYTYAWSNGFNTPAVSIKAPGNYTVTITNNANTNCHYVSNQVVVSVDSFPAFTLGDDTAICSGNRLTFAYSNPLSSILWSTGDTTLETVITATNNYWVVALNQNGCTARDTIHATIKGIAPNVGFTSPILCTYDTLQFIDTTSAPNGVPLSTWLWNFGDGTTDSVRNPTHVYTATGDYTISLVISTDSGCVNSTVKNFTAYLKPDAIFVSRVSCANSETQFTDLSVTAFPASLYLWKWNFGSLDSSVLRNPVFSFPAQGKYEVSLKVTNTDGCVSIQRDSVEVFARFDADFEYTNLCVGDSVLFKDNTPSYSVVKWLWNTGDNYLNTTKTFKHKYSLPGAYPVTLRVENAIGCVDIVTDSVRIYPKPVANFDDGITCEDRYFTPVDRSVVVEQNNTWKWTIAGSHYTGQAPQHFFADTGLYGVSLLLTSANGCKDTATGAVKVSPNPIADFVLSPQYGDAPLLATFTNLSRHAQSYVWTFGDGATDNATNPTHTYTSNSTYDIKLVAVNSAGCTDSVTKQLTVTTTDLDISVDRVYVTKAPLSDGTVLVTTFVDLSNQGTRLITNTQLYATIGSGGVLSEQLDTLIPSAQGIPYMFAAKFVVAAENANTYVCVEAVRVNNGETESRLDNNSECISLTDVIQVIGPSPNPARGSANLGIVLSKAGKVTVEIMDVLGQPVMDMVELDLPSGRSDYALPVKLLRAGEYFVRIKNNDEKLIRKMIVH